MTRRTFLLNCHYFALLPGSPIASSSATMLPHFSFLLALLGLPTHLCVLLLPTCHRCW